MLSERGYKISFATRRILSDEEINTYKLLPGDILINRVNSRELVGKAAVIPNDFEISVYESKNIRIKINSGIIDSFYLNYCFSSTYKLHFI